MSKIRVLIVDDAVVVRQLLSSALAADPELEVVGSAASGRRALERREELNPDVILLDLEMPEMDGLETLTALRQVDPNVAVIMFSRHTHRGVEATVRALMLGANDYVPKPGDGIGVKECVQEQLIPKVKLHGRRRASGGLTPPESAIQPPEGEQSSRSREPHSGGLRPPLASGPRAPVAVVGIGCSTGGPNALAAILPALPADWAVPTLIVQHMPAGFTARLAERLAEKARLDVREAVAGESVRAAQVWVAAGDFHLAVERSGAGRRLVLNQGPPVNSCRPSVDVLFRSLAEVYGPGVLVVVLTGLGEDGLRGCEAVRAAGGQVLVQDEASSVVWSMPGVVARAGLADAVLPLERLGAEVVARALLK